MSTPVDAAAVAGLGVALAVWIVMTDRKVARTEHPTGPPRT